jgi:broad specificity phosphatase PhoE
VLLLVRHGETTANVDGLLLGRADPPLTDLGRRQARALARALPTPARLISSPLARALETARAFDTAAEVDNRWVELDYGDLDLLPVAAVPADVWARWRDDPTFAPGGGESLRDLGARVEDACADIAEAASASVVVVVTHVSPIKAAIAWTLGVSHDIAWRMHVEDASVSRIDVGAHGAVLRWFNRHPPPTA